MKLKRVIRVHGLVFLLLLGLNPQVKAQIQDGKGFFEFSEYAPMKENKMRVFYYKPAGDVKDMPILFVMHGTLRNAEVYRNNWVSLADQYKVLVIVPEFTKKDFPGSRMYNYGNLISKNKMNVEEKFWSYSLIDPIFESVVKQTNSNQKKYDLFGHSAGSQFAHRFFLFKKNTKAHRVVASNAGSYTMPTLDVAFPFGLQGTQYNEKKLKESLAKKLIVQLGEADTDPNHRYLNTGEDAMKQGSNRFERGLNFYKTAKELAAKRDVDFNWEVRTVPGVGHENDKMAIDAAQYLYGK